MTISVSHLYFYPVKSCAGIELKSAHVGARGIEHDREWMIVDEANVFQTQRDLHKMCLIKPSLADRANKCGLVLKAPGMQPIEVPLLADGEHRTVKVFNDTCAANDQGNDAADWLSEFLKTKVRLVRMSNSHVRHVSPRFAKRSTDQVGFADGYPCLLVSQESLDELNQQLAKPVHMNRFRPNIVVTGCGASAEDRWTTVQIATIKFDVVKPCVRCVITTIDQATANTGVEPLRTLSKYRNTERGVIFGQNLLHDTAGTIQVGDEVQVVAGR